MDVSVIICTRNRCADLIRVIDSLAAVTVPDQVSWEVVIVDNGSSDGTGAVCRALANKNPDRFTCVVEPRKGKSIALNAAICLAKGEILAFTDDDCIVTKSWINEILGEFTADAELGLLGGRVLLHDNQHADLTTVKSDKRFVVSSPAMLYPDPPIIGCNMAARKAVVIAAGGFDVSLGPGTKAICEDVDLVYRVCKRGFKVEFCPNVLVYHNHCRVTGHELGLLLFRYQVGRGAFYFKHMRDREVAKLAFKDFRRSLIQICTLQRGIRGNVRFLQALLVGVTTRCRKVVM